MNAGGTGEGELQSLRPAAGIPHARAQALLGWWSALPRRRRWPDWRDVEKVSLKPWMGWLVLYDVIDDGADFRYRLVGSEIAERSGFDLTGRLVSEAAYSAENDRFRRRLARLQRNGEPCWIDQPMQTTRGFSVVHDRLCLPFANGGDDLALWLFYVCGDEVLVDRYHRQ